MRSDLTGTVEEITAAYAAARESSLVVQHETPGLLRLRGTNTLDFLHRMSTNDMVGLEPGAMHGTVLTTAIGRIVDVVYALRRPAEILLLTTPGRQGAVRGWLGRYIFFEDDVRIEGVADPFSFFGVYGPLSATKAEALGAPWPLAPGGFSELGDGLMWETALPVPGFRLLAGVETDARARSQWGEQAIAPAGRMAVPSTMTL